MLKFNNKNIPSAEKMERKFLVIPHHSLKFLTTLKVLTDRLN